MGMFLHATCEQCWDTLPCNCERQKERDASAQASIAHERQRREEEQIALLREQNELLRKLVDRK